MSQFNYDFTSFSTSNFQRNFYTTCIVLEIEWFEFYESWKQTKQNKHCKVQNTNNIFVTLNTTFSAFVTLHIWI